jgi:hypothetical protein
MFTKKIQCQLTAWVSTPPASSPIMVTIMPRVTAEVSAPPIPCTNRAAISTAWLSASPQASDASVKRALESAPAGSTLHAVADEGVPIRTVAEAVGRHLDKGRYFNGLAIMP